ncbi:hypothetical protein Leryth_005511 [Lithospermum erythrorhizon]|nr:hypothetical protein Leryth_005511 [Lithospermum erythrorhizon]
MVMSFVWKSTSFKDDEYFISSIRKKQHLEAGLSLRADEGFESNRLEAAVLDLVSDDKNGLRKQKSTYHWDKRHKKYVKLNNGDRVTASGKVLSCSLAFEDVNWSVGPHREGKLT